MKCSGEKALAAAFPPCRLWWRYSEEMNLVQIGPITPIQGKGMALRSGGGHGVLVDAGSSLMGVGGKEEICTPNGPLAQK